MSHSTTDVGGHLHLDRYGAPIEVGPEHTLCILRGAVHAFTNQSSSVDAKVLVMASPAAIGPKFFRETAAVLHANDTKAGEKIDSDLFLC